MQLHQIQPNHQNKSSKRIGRGGKRGTYSGRGIKGQAARAGAKFQPIIRELIKKYPKLRGYRQVLVPGAVVSVNLDVLEKKFSEGEVVSPKTLLEKKIIRKIKGQEPQVKILGRGELKKKLKFEGCSFSAKAKEKV